MKRAAIAAILAAAALVLAACGQGAVGYTPDAEPTAEVFTVKLDDGRTIDCLYLEHGYGNASTGGPSCDWSTAK